MGGESIPYHLRPNKAIERGLFIDLLSRVGRRFNVSDYVYYGFGGPFMEDFRAFHAALRIQRMHSIERDPVVQERQKFNSPFSGVTYELADCSEFITRFSPDEPAVVWLDFTSPGELKQQLDDTRNLVSKLASGDVFKITLNARVASLFENPTLNEEQLKVVRKSVYETRAAEYLPAGLALDEFRPDRYANLLLKSVSLAVEKGVYASAGLVAQPLCAFAYGDGQQMLTATGVVLAEKEVENFLQVTRLGDWPFSELAWKRAQAISAPVLSTKERLLLESHVPKASIPDIKAALGGMLGDNGITYEDIKAFIRYYRVYPHYGKIAI